MSKWISVRDRLPPEGVPVLVTGSGWLDADKPPEPGYEVAVMKLWEYRGTMRPSWSICDDEYSTEADYWMPIEPSPMLTCEHVFLLNTGDQARPFATETCVRCGVERTIRGEKESTVTEQLGAAA